MSRNIKIYNEDKKNLSSIVNSISLIVTTKLKNSPKNILTLSKIFIVFIKSIPAISATGLLESSEYSLKDITKTFICAFGSIQESKNEEIEKKLPGISIKIKQCLDKISKKTISQSKYIFSESTTKEKALITKRSIEQTSIKKYKALPTQEKDIPDHLVEEYAKKFAKLCYMVGFEQSTQR